MTRAEDKETEENQVYSNLVMTEQNEWVTRGGVIRRTASISITS